MLNFFLFLLHSGYADVCWKTELGEIICDRFHISVTKCERKFTAFASKLLQIPKKSIALTNCNLQQKALDFRSYKIRF